MKSQRYQILPRVRFHADKNLYQCDWKDPGQLMQRKGAPLRYVQIYRGYGNTIDEAIHNCQLSYLLQRGAMYPTPALKRPPYIEIKAPDHCLATSNLPWWKRLFRV